MVEAIKKILITGASGLLGRELLSVLSGDFEVTGMRRKRPLSLIENKVKEIRCDLSQSQAVERIVDCSPEIIVHAAALSNVDFCQIHPRQAQRHNVLGTKIVVEAAQRLGARLIYLSTDQVFDGEKESLYNEGDSPQPVNTYGETKLEAERIIQSNLKKYIILRVSWLFGNLKDDFISFVLKSAQRSKVINIVYDKISSPTYTLDLARAIKYLIGSLFFEGEIVHFTNSGKGCSWLEYGREILKAAGLDATDIKPIKLKDLNLPAPRPRSSALDNSKFLKIVNRPLRTWQEALDGCIKSRFNKKDRE